MAQHFHFSFPVEQEVHSSISGSDTAVCVCLCVRACVLLLTPAGQGNRKWAAEEPHIGGVGRSEPGGGGIL